MSPFCVPVGLQKSSQDTLMIKLWLGEGEDDTTLIEKIRRVIREERSWYKQWLSLKTLSLSIESYRLWNEADYGKSRSFIYLVEIKRKKAVYLKDLHRFFPDLADQVNGYPPPQRTKRDNLSWPWMNCPQQAK
ncbi:hypothetical protein RUND412_005575 [Rhizina undulata]